MQTSVSGVTVPDGQDVLTWNGQAEVAPVSVSPVADYLRKESRARA